MSILFAAAIDFLLVHVSVRIIFSFPNRFIGSSNNFLIALYVVLPFWQTTQDSRSTGTTRQNADRLDSSYSSRVTIDMLEKYDGA